MVFPMSGYANELITIIKIVVGTFLLCGIYWVFGTDKNRWSQFFIWCIIGLPLCFLTFVSNTGSVSANYFMHVMVTILAMKLVGYLNLKWTDYAFFLIGIFVVRGYYIVGKINTSYVVFVIWIFLLVASKRRYKNLNVIGIPCFLTYAAGILSYYMYNFFKESLLDKVYGRLLRWSGVQNWHKVLFLLCAGFVFLLVWGLGLILLKMLLRNNFQRLNEIGQKYREIGNYTYIGTTAFLALMVVVEQGYLSLIRDNGIGKTFIIAVFALFFIGLQLYYIRMLLKTVQLKEKIQQKEREQESLQLYNSRLEENMQEIRAIKHDMKNVFLTMGEYVKRSHDEDMKSFYQEKIIPFASDEIKMNDIYTELQKIKDESLKAFFYYKIMQGITAKVNMELHVDMDSSFFVNFQNLPDIIRVLGIFIDNGMEETRFVDGGVVSISLKEKQKEMTILVKNSIRTETKQKGIVEGTTTKGLGRGNGLTIAKNILGKYGDILWNSYFQEGMFVQMITYQKDAA